MTIEAGNRVRDRKWGGVHNGTVTRVDNADDLRERSAEGDTDPTLYVYVQWDGASFTEDQLAPHEIELIPGEGDPTLGVGIFVVPDAR